MKRLLILSSLVLTTAACQPVPKAGNPAISAGSATPPTPPATTQAAVRPPVGTPAEDPWTAGVTEIITRPQLAARPTTTQPGVQGTAVAPAHSAPTPAGSEVATPKLPLTEVKKIDTSISTAPLVRLIGMKLNNIPYERFAGYGVVDFTPKLPEGTDPDAMTNDILGRDPSGTAGAVERLIKGEVDMVVVSRLPTPNEYDAAGKAGVTLRHDLLATEALVFTVNINNPASNVSIGALKSYFSGEAKTWADLKLVDFPLTNEIASKPITVAYRANGLGTEELMEQLLLGGQNLPELPMSEALSSSKLVLDATNEDPATLGFSVFCYASNMDRDGRIKALAVNGVLPEPTRIAAGEYPLTTPIYLLTRTNIDPESPLLSLRKWLLAMPGQKVLAEAGYMPIVAEAWTQQRLMSGAN